MTKEARNPNDESASGSSLAEEAFWGSAPDSEPMVLRDEPSGKPVYDLEERTAKFGEAIVLFAKKIPHRPVNNRLIDQLVGAGTSVGANYCEADDGVSKKDFRAQDRNLPERGAGNEILPANGSNLGISTQTGGACALAGSQGTAPHLLQNLAELNDESALNN